MTREDQINYWLAGISKHNSDTGRCCPDFSCCYNQLQVDLEERINFVLALKHRNYDILYGMCENYYLKMLLHIGYVYTPIKEFDA